MNNPTNPYFARCLSCLRWKKIEQGNGHPWCGCASDEFDWSDLRDHDPEPLASMTCTTTAASQPTSAVDLMAQLDRMAQLINSMPPEPIGEWMRQRGNPPEQWCLVLPESMRTAPDAPAFWPEYVRFSPLTKAGSVFFLPRWQLDAFWRPITGVGTDGQRG